MGKKTDAANAIRQLAVQYQGMMEAADLLEQTGSFEQAAAEAKAAAAEAAAAREAALVTLSETIERISKVEDEAKSIESKANADALAIVAAAESKAQGIIDQAKADGAAKIAGLLGPANDQLAVLTAEAKRLSDAISMEEETLRQLRAQTQQANDDAKAAEKKLAAVRNTIAKLAGVE